MYGGETRMDPVVYLLRKTLGPASAAAVGLFFCCCYFVVSFYLVY